MSNEKLEGSQIHQVTINTINRTNRTLTKALFFSMGIVLVMAIYIILSAVLREDIKVLAVTPDLRVVELRPLSEPIITDTGINAFTGRVVLESLSLDFKHWKAKLASVRPNYTKAGFSSLIGPLKSSGNLDAIVKRRLIASPSIDGAAIIKAEGPYKGGYAWKIDIPVVVSYEGGSGQQNVQTLMAEVLVIRQSLIKHSEGVAIENITFKARNN